MNFIKKFGLWMTVWAHLSVYYVASTCNDFQFQCDDGECVPMIKLCNGRRDCNDNSDEAKCSSENYPKCKRGFFQCVSDRHCIPLGWACDDDEDCDDDSDERNCHASSCSRHHDFECLSNKQCISREMVCNGKNDCEDGSDEQNCEEYACLEGNVACQDNSRCISKEWLCDGDEDCDDGADEKECDSNQPVTLTPARNPPETTYLSCPDHYCEQNAECVVIEGQYHCNCSPPFAGEKCERRITSERNFQDLGVVIGVAMTLVTLFIITALMLFCYYKRRTSRNSTALISNNEKQMPFTSYSKE